MTQAQNTQATTTEVTAGFRIVVRGKNAAGTRVRKVQTVQATSLEAANDVAGPIAEKMAEGLTDIYFNVYPPVGELCNGGLSKGFAIVDGRVVKQAAAPAPAAAPAAATAA